MTEEVKEVEVKETVIEEEPKEDPIEELAKEIGWNPKHEDGDREFLSAKDFILKSKEIQNTNAKQIKSMKNKLENNARTVDELKQHNEMVYKAQLTQLKNELSNLRAERKRAVDDDDDVRVSEIDDQIKTMQNVPTELPKSKAAEVHPDFIKWQDDNEWYEVDDELRKYADYLGSTPEYQALAGVNLKRCLKKIEKTVKDEFPEKFGTKKTPPAAPAAPAVEGSTRKSTHKPKFTMKDLNDEQRKIAKDFAAMKVMTVEEYINDLVKIGELT